MLEQTDVRDNHPSVLDLKNNPVGHVSKLYVGGQNRLTHYKKNIYMYVGEYPKQTGLRTFWIVVCIFHYNKAVIYYIYM